jgi:hypothetical protein
MKKSPAKVSCLPVVICSLFLACLTSQGDVSLLPVDWGGGGDTLGWINISGNAKPLTSPGTGGNPDGYLAIDFDAVAPFDPQSADVANSGAGYTGDYSGHGLKFDLLGYAAAPTALYFISDGGASSWTLQLDYDPIVDHTWKSFDVNFFGQGAWARKTGTVDFLTAISQVDSIGLLFEFFSWGEPLNFGVDNWQFYLGNQFYVPEPGVTAMGVILALSAMFWARRTMRSRRV